MFFVVAIAVAAFLSPFASTSPDGLDRVAQDLGFEEKSEGKEVIKALIPDYKFPGVENESFATSLAGIVGTLLAFGLSYATGRICGQRKRAVL